jgi:hypothetical protein
MPSPTAQARAVVSRSKGFDTASRSFPTSGFPATATFSAVSPGTGTEADTVIWTTVALVVVSILVHGATADPLSRRLLDEDP